MHVVTTHVVVLALAVAYSDCANSNCRNWRTATMENERLIELVRTHPVLYDHTHPKYSDNQYKEKTWKEIGRDLNNSSKIPRSLRLDFIFIFMISSIHLSIQLQGRQPQSD